MPAARDLDSPAVPQRAPFLTAGRVSPRRPVPAGIDRPEYVDKPRPAPYRGSHVQPAEVVERMRTACRIAAQAAQAGGRHVQPGTTTDAIDAVVHEFLLDHGAYPSTLGYRGFPKSCCTSVNEVVCHGIPDDRPLAEGDVCSIDVTAYVVLDGIGVHGDTCVTFGAGELDDASALLMERARAATDRGIAAVRPGREVNVIGRVVETFARRHGYGSVKEYTGHGIGTAFHSGLVIPHHDAAPAHADVIETGMTFTVEPMITEGSAAVEVWDDGWTVVTRDRGRVAQFEHTVLVTETGAEVLTLP
ncbi:type I methionyl aminopeptidase [Quadrisphaera granulorum]|uniref:type I methionyl aminopeptidase n=1 Tax=Quadrisphaera granulorum TaxID=317664 RepID=UPI001FE70FBA|nr:type I methionyl aminopeptidase [Quadrisphaera granulorum]